MRILYLVALTVALTACGVHYDEPVRPVDHPTSNAYAPATTEAQRLAEWDGSGQKPYGSGSNDGRFSDVQCGCQPPARGDCAHPTCWYTQDGTEAVQNLSWRGTHLYWDSHYLGHCVERIVLWNYDTTSPECERER